MIEYAIFLFRVLLSVYFIFGSYDLYFLYLTGDIKNSYEITIDNLEIIVNDISRCIYNCNEII